MLRILFGITTVLCLAACSKTDTPEPADKLLSDTVLSIAATADGFVWVATAKGLESFKDGVWKSYGKAYNTTLQAANSVFVQIGSIGFATDNGSFHFKTLGNNIIGETDYNVLNSGIASNKVSAIGMGSVTGTFFGTDKGISIFDNNSWSVFTGRSKEEILKQYRITAIATAKNGYTYASTLGGGVSRFKYTDAVTGATTYTAQWASGLKTDTVYCVAIASDTCQWFGTNMGVAYHTSISTKWNWFAYNHTDGLVCDTVLAIVCDNAGNTWFGTANGLGTFNGAVWKSYTTSNGLPGNRINTLAIAPDNTLWIGTDNGLSHMADGQFVNYSSSGNGAK